MISSTVVIGASGQRLVTRVEASPSPFRGTSPRRPTRGATRPARHRHRLHPSEGYAGTPKGGNRVRAAQNAHAAAEHTRAFRAKLVTLQGALYDERLYRPLR